MLMKRARTSAKAHIEQAQFERRMSIPRSMFDTDFPVQEIHGLMRACVWVKSLRRSRRRLFTLKAGYPEPQLAVMSLQGTLFLEMLPCILRWFSQRGQLVFDPLIEALFDQLSTTHPLFFSSSPSLQMSPTMQCDALNGMVHRLRAEITKPGFVQQQHRADMWLRARSGQTSKALKAGVSAAATPTFVNVDLETRSINWQGIEQPGALAARNSMVQQLKVQFGPALKAQAWKFDLTSFGGFKIHQTFVVDGLQGTERSELIDAIRRAWSTSVGAQGSADVIDCDSSGMGLFFRGYDVSTNFAWEDAAELVARIVTYHVLCDRLVAARPWKGQATFGASGL